MAKEEQTDALAEGGPGVGKIKDKKLDALADKFCELRDAKAEMAEKMTGLEVQIIDRMIEAKIQLYRYADREVRVKPGKNHVRVKTVKVAAED